MTRWLPRAAVLVALGCTTLGGVALARLLPGGASHFADANDKVLVLLGKRVYAANCASCHGRSLQGQPLWQLADRDSSRRAPALDQTGHSWLRADDDLFRIAKFGGLWPAPNAPGAMPAFGAVLSDGELLAVVAFIKARWPFGMRVAQSVFNPGYAGMPRDAARPAWTFPAMCRSRF
jgi:mono/diheme cytochrome c family protein